MLLCTVMWLMFSHVLIFSDEIIILNLKCVTQNLLPFPQGNNLVLILGSFFFYFLQDETLPSKQWLMAWPQCNPICYSVVSFTPFVKTLHNKTCDIASTKKGLGNGEVVKAISSSNFVLYSEWPHIKNIWVSSSTFIWDSSKKKVMT